MPPVGTTGLPAITILSADSARSSFSSHLCICFAGYNLAGWTWFQKHINGHGTSKLDGVSIARVCRDKNKYSGELFQRSHAWYDLSLVGFCLSRFSRLSKVTGSNFGARRYRQSFLPEFRKKTVNRQPPTASNVSPLEYLFNHPRCSLRCILKPSSGPRLTSSTSLRPKQ